MKALTVRAPAKVNLALDVTGRTGDGYHLLETVMLAVDLWDELDIRPREDAAIRIHCDRAGVPTGPENLAHRAAEAFFAHSGLPPVGLDIRIRKRVPMEAGLAGGSADAAGVLVGLDRLTNSGLSGKELEAIALELGADVPFCVRGGCALARGVGERFQPLPVPVDAWLVLAKPTGGMSTAEAFRRYDSLAEAVARPDLPAMCRALEAGNLPGIGAAMGNVLEAVCDLEAVGELKQRLLALGALGAVMTGSGTAVCGLFADPERARRAADQLRTPGVEVFLTRPLPHGAKGCP